MRLASIVFPGARRTDKNNVVASGAGHFQRALGGLLPAHVAQVHRSIAPLRRASARRPRCTGVNDSGALTKSTACGSDFTAKTSMPSTTAASRAFASGTTTARMPLFSRRKRRRKRAAHRTHAAVQRQFAQKNILIQRLAEKCSLAAQNSQRHGQIERRAFLANVGGRQIHRDALSRWEIQSRNFSAPT